MKRATFWVGAAALLCFGYGLCSPGPSSALTAELAKKCQRLAVKAYPPVLTGMKKGNAANERAYFKECVSKGGDMPEPTPKPQNQDPVKAQKVTPKPQ